MNERFRTTLPRSVEPRASLRPLALFQHPLLPVVLLFAANSLLWALVLAPGSGPDEWAHIDYVRNLVSRRALPIFGVTTTTTNPNAYSLQAMQPPLYYLLEAPILAALARAPSEVQLLGLRALSVLIGTATVVLTYVLGRALVPERPRFALAVAALTAFNPMFTFVSAYVANDGLAALCCVALLLCWVKLLAGPTRSWLIATGVTVGLGLLSKFSVLPVVALTGLLIVWLALRQPLPLRSLARFALLTGLPALAISGWMLARNWWLYGDPTTLTMFSRYPDVYPARSYAEAGTLWEMLTTGRGGYIGFWDGLIHGFWGIFDFYTIWLSKRLYFVLDSVLFVGIVGSALGLAQMLFRRQGPLARPSLDADGAKEERRTTKAGGVRLSSLVIARTGDAERQLLFVGLALLLVFAVIWSNISRSYQIDYQPQGRYLLPILVPVMLLLVCGWEQLLGVLRVRHLAAPLLTSIMLAANLVALITALVPTYHDAYVRRVFEESSPQPAFGPFAAQTTFVAPAAPIDRLEVLADIPEGAAGPLIWRIRAEGAARDLAAALHTDISPGLTRYQIALDAAFVPGQRYTLLLQAPWANGNAPVRAFPDHSDEFGLQVVSASSPKTLLEHLDTRLRTGDARSLIGMGQRILYPLVLALVIVTVPLLFHARPRVFTVLGSLVCFGLACMVLYAPPLVLPAQIVIDAQQIRATAGSVALFANDDPQVFANLILLSAGPSAHKNPPDDVERQLSLIQPFRYTINGDERPVLSMHPASAITYTLELPPGAVLRAALALDPQVWQPDKGDGVEFVVAVRDRYSQHELLRQYIDPKHHPEDQRWHDVSVDLSAFVGETVELRLETLPGPAGDSSNDWAGWATPVIVQGQ